MRDDVKDLGYDREEEYFRRKNRELIERRRAELDVERREREANELRERYWMRCPKCGHELAGEEMAGIKIDRCAECGGVYFDEGELELLLETREPEGFLAALRQRLLG